MRNVSFKKVFYEFSDALSVPAASIRHVKGHHLPYGNYLSTPGYGRILLIGDACGLADPISGEGIYYAHKSAEAASRAIISSWPDTVQALPAYQRNLAPTLWELKCMNFWRYPFFGLLVKQNAIPLARLMQIFKKSLEDKVQGKSAFNRIGFFSRTPV